MAAIFWFKRDLRMQDNPGLALAAEAGPVLPVYIVEPALWAEPDYSGRQWAFTSECLAEMRSACAARGAPLVVRVGEAVAVFETLRRSHGITRIVSTEETGNAWTYRRDLAVGAWARGAGVDWREVPQQGVVRRLRSRDGWAAQRERVMRQPLVPVPPVRFDALGEAPGGIPTGAELGLVDHCPGRQSGGRAEGLRLMRSFLDARGRDYRSAMSSPVAGETACSRLSPYIALGALSVREVVQATEARKVEVRGARDSWPGALKSFSARLAWRDHFMQKLESAPGIETRCLHPAYEGMRPRVPDPVRLQAWEQGETGLPFVDACMRYLNATGWLNFRMRAMLMAVASYHLWLDWRATGAHLARAFTDYEPGIHWSQAQMQSGVTGMNTIRVYNPVKQGYDQDPTGVFTRAWVPELAAVPDRFLHEPWNWEGAGQVLDRVYPAPIVDVAEAAREAKARVYAVRREAGFRETAQAIVKTHASRKPARPRRAPPSAQLSLDL